MTYRATHLKSGHVSTLSADKVRQIQENGFGHLFTFEAVNDDIPAEMPEPEETEPETPEEIEPEERPKGKKTAK